MASFSLDPAGPLSLLLSRGGSQAASGDGVLVSPIPVRPLRPDLAAMEDSSSSSNSGELLPLPAWVASRAAVISPVAPVVRKPSTGNFSPGAGRRGGASLLASPIHLSQEEVVLTPDQVKTRLGKLQLYSSMPLDEHDVLPVPLLEKAGESLTTSDVELIRQTHEMTKTSTPKKKFEDFLESRLHSGDLFTRVSEEEFASHFLLTDFLGEGATSSVRVGKRSSDGKEFAVKAIPASLLLRHRTLIREAAILGRLRHPSIVRLHEAYLTDDHLYLVMDLIEKAVPLFESIIERHTFSEDDARSLIANLLEAVEYLHRHGVAHRDLKPENILIDTETGHLTLIDFGSSGVEAGGLSSPGGTIGYQAPDFFSAKHSKLVDIWSVGVLAYILCVGFPPFMSNRSIRDDVDFLSNAPFWYFINADTPELKREIAEGHVTFPSPFFDNISDEAKDFIRALLNIDDATRLTAKEALLHPWIVTKRLAIAEGNPRHLLAATCSRSSPDVLQTLPLIVRERILGLKEMHSGK